MLATTLRIVLPLLLTVVVVWAVVFAWWADQERTPSLRDMALYMAGLPIALLGGYWLLKGFIDGLRKPPVGTHASASQAAIDSPASAATSADTPLALPFALTAGFMHTAHGEDNAALRQALDEGKRPGPAPGLMDAEGFPVFAAPIEGLDCEAIADQLQALALAQQGATIHQPAVLRALAALARTLPAISEMLAADESDTADGAGASDTIAKCSGGALRTHWLVPHDWPGSCFPLLAAWFSSQFEPDAAALADLEIVPARSAQAVLHHLATLAPNADGKDVRHLVLAAQSFVTDEAIQGWQMADQLFSAERQHGRIPGEAAAAILLAPAGATERPGPLIGPPLSQPRQHAADAGRPSCETLQALIEAAQQQHRLAPTQFAAVVSDTDHRASRSAELFAALGEGFDHLDPGADVVALGTACGDTGIVSPLLSLLLACDLVAERDQAVLCIFAQDALDRSVLALLPAARPTPLAATS